MTSYISDVPYFFKSNLRPKKSVKDGKVQFQLECDRDTAKVTWFINGEKIEPDGHR